MKAYILIQTGNANTHWTSLFLRGITSEAKNRGMETVSAESDGLTLPQSHNDAVAVLAIGSSFDWTVTVSKMLRSKGKKLYSLPLTSSKVQMQRLSLQFYHHTLTGFAPCHCYLCT